jgi:hypothetical protein
MNITPPHNSLDSASIVVRAKEIFQLWCVSIVPHMPRTARYTVGTRIEYHFLSLLENIYQAYYTQPDKKLEKIIKCIHETDLLKFLIQIAWENKLIKDTHYIEISTKILEVGKILGGWKNNTQAKLLKQKENPRE